MKQLSVTMFLRKPEEGKHSIERLFSSVREHLPPDISCTVSVASKSSRGLLPRMRITLEAALRQGDVNHVTGDVHFMTLFMRPSTTILTVHDLVTVNRLNGLRRWVYKLLWFRLPIARTRCVTVVSNETRDHLLREFGPLRQEVRVIHNPLLDGFHRSEKALDTENPVVLLVGLAPNKNFERVVSALSNIPCRLRVIGRLSQKQLELLQASSLPFSNAYGLSDQAMQQEYVNSDMLVFASIAEGFGMPILEAQATGRPVVTSNISSMPEVAGDAAEFVDPLNVDSIRAGVLRVIEDPERRTSMIQRGYKNVERFSPDHIASQYAELYREVAYRNKS